MTRLPRRATAEDSDEVARVLIESRRAAGAAIPPSVHSDEETMAWVRDRLIVEAEVWIVSDPTPCAVLVLTDRWIEQLYVAAERTGQGLGSLLVELAKQLRPAGLEQWTFASNAGAQRFYERHGFVVAEHTDGSGNEERAPDIRYVWGPQ